MSIKNVLLNYNAPISEWVKTQDLKRNSSVIPVNISLIGFNYKTPEVAIAQSGDKLGVRPIAGEPVNIQVNEYDYNDSGKELFNECKYIVSISIKIYSDSNLTHINREYMYTFRGQDATALYSENLLSLIDNVMVNVRNDYKYFYPVGIYMTYTIESINVMLSDFDDVGVQYNEE